MRQILLLMVFVINIVGCQNPTLQLEIEPPRNSAYTDSDTPSAEVNSYIDVNDLDMSVREYVRKNEIEFDFRGTSGDFKVTRARACLAEGTYRSGLWEPILSIEIGWDGRVKNHQVAIPICGHGLNEIIGTDVDPYTGEN